MNGGHGTQVWRRSPRTHRVCAVGTPLSSLVGCGGSGAASGSPVGSPAPGHGMPVPIRRGRRSVRQPASSDWSALTAAGGQIPAQGRLPRPSLAAPPCLRGLQTPRSPVSGPGVGTQIPSLLFPPPSSSGPGWTAGLLGRHLAAEPRGTGCGRRGQGGHPSPDGVTQFSLPCGSPEFPTGNELQPRLSQGRGCGPLLPLVPQAQPRTAAPLSVPGCGTMLPGRLQVVSEGSPRGPTPGTSTSQSFF